MTQVLLSYQAVYCADRYTIILKLKRTAKWRVMQSHRKIWFLFFLCRLHLACLLHLFKNVYKYISPQCFLRSVRSDEYFSLFMTLFLMVFSLFCPHCSCKRLLFFFPFFFFFVSFLLLSPLSFSF